MPFRRRSALAVLVAAALATPTAAVAVGSEAPRPGDPKANRALVTSGAAPESGSERRLRTLSPAPDSSRVRLAIRARGGASAPRATLSSIASAAEAGGASSPRTLKRPGLVSVSVPRALAPALAARLERRSDVTDVVHLNRRSLALVPNDELYVQTSSYLGAVNAPTAWDVHTSSSSVKIAVLDTGVDVAHPDLQGRVVGQYNAVTGGTDVTDDIGHGTFVAGVAAATGNNSVGIAGASFGASVLAVKVADANGDIWTDDVAAGIYWAADNGADVINLSLGGPTTDDVEGAAVAYARSKGVVVVAAAGNENTTAKSYPAATTGVIGVGATDAAGHRADFSNYGSWVKVAAPGVGITGTAPGGSYEQGDGTSFSSPIVAGEAALLTSFRPDLSAQDVERTIIASAHGYADLGLGAGQVDLRAALATARPETVPDLRTPVAGSTVKGWVALVADSSAPKVRFVVDGVQLGGLVATADDGTARVAWPTWGLSNRAHTVAVADCSSVDLCSPPSSPVSVTVANEAPVITAPKPGVTVSGSTTFTATAAGGAVGFYVDDVRKTVDTTAPYSLTFPVSSLSDGTHTLRITGCFATPTIVCNGPSSTVSFVNRSLHPRFSSVRPAVFSPNKDGRSDTAKISWYLPESQNVSLRIRNAAGTVVRGPLSWSAQSTGYHSYVWNGLSNGGTRQVSGTYTVELTSTKVKDGATVRGAATTTLRIDLAAPTTSRVTGNGGSIYPYKDGYKDTWSTRFDLNEKGTVSLRIRNSKGTTVRTVTASLPAGRGGLAWNGRTSSGTQVAAGSYRWNLVTQDAAGNRRTSPTYTLTVSGRKLVTKTVTATKNGASSVFITTSAETDCAGYSEDYSDFAPYGVWLVNDCPGDEVVGAGYRFTVPSAYSYGTVKLETYGNSLTPSKIGGSFTVWATDGGRSTSLVSTGRTNAWRTVGTVSATGLVNSNKIVEAVLFVPSYYAENDYDVSKVRVTITYKVLG